MMADDGHRMSGFSSGLAVLLPGEGKKEISQKSHLVSFCDEIGEQSLERTLEHIFDLPHKSIASSSRAVDADLIRSILNNQRGKFRETNNSSCQGRSGLTFARSGHEPDAVVLDKASNCGELRVLREPLLVESFTMFSSARANACVCRGKWMYEVTLETCGIQQLGWTTHACPFTDHKGVGDAEDSYAFDGRRVSKWNKDARTYGQPWAIGDVIGCCIDLDTCEISFYRNGLSLGIAFEGIRKSGIGCGYFPAISLSEGERCYLNFGNQPFRYPIRGFLPIQEPPSLNSFATYLLECLTRLLDMQLFDRSGSTSFEKVRRLKRFTPSEKLLHSISHGICDEFLTTIEEVKGSMEYIAWGSFTSFLLQVFGKQAPHEYSNLDQVVNLFLEFPGSRPLFEHVIMALSCGCRTAPLVLMECPYSGSYPYLALACHFLRNEHLMTLWWKSLNFQSSLEGFLSRKGLNKLDLQYLIPSVWWPGCFEDMSSESSMTLTTIALSGAISKIEELHRELCCLVIQFIPPATPHQSPGSVFRTFIQNLILKTRSQDHKVSPGGGSSAVASLYMVILHFLSEGFAIKNPFGLAEGSKIDGPGFLHKGGKRSFPVALFLNSHLTDIPRLGGSFNHLMSSHPLNDQKFEEIQWNEGFAEDEETRITHSTRQKPCCCSSPDVSFTSILKDPMKYSTKGCKGPCNPVSHRSHHVAAECSAGSLDNEIVDKPGSSGQSESDFGCRLLQSMENVSKSSTLSSDMLREEELLDFMVLLYHIGVTPIIKQASYYMSHQSQSISLLEETDRQISEKTSNEQLKRLKEARNVYREELVDCVRQCSWYRLCLSSRWKQRGMYASCIWIVELLLALQNDNLLFVYIPEFFVEALVDCFHALRQSDPAFVSSEIFIKQGLASFVTFIVTYFDDPRISSADLKDILLQSVSVLVQYKDYLIAFENNKEAIQRLPKSLLLAFDNRSWTLVTNILQRLCKGSGFGSSKHGESSSSILFQGLLRDTCLQDEALFSCFLNRLFNTLSWTMTEFAISIREMQENYQIPELQQRKSTVIFDLSCSLARILEFCTREIPHAFLSGPNMNLQRLIELIIFILNHIISAVDSEFFGMSFRRRHGQNSEKTNRAMILAPLVGIILNIVDATTDTVEGKQNDVIEVFVSMDCPNTIHCGFQYLLGYNWGSALRGDAALARLSHLEQFLRCLTSRAETGGGRVVSRHEGSGEEENMESCCCICYSCDSDAEFEPCHHKSCFRCITRHLLNSQRCFFCNAVVTNVLKTDTKFPLSE